jgi:surface protein
VSFNIIDPIAQCPQVVSVLIDCDTGYSYYVAGVPQYNGVALAPGFYIRADINGTVVCVEFLLTSLNLTPNSVINQIVAIYPDCVTCTPPLFKFVSIWRTTTLNETITLPFESAGNYDCFVEWGDLSNIDHITTYNQPQTKHTFRNPGTYIVTISAQTANLTGWSFNGGGDGYKLMSVREWGPLRLGNSGGYFKGCNFLDLSRVIDTLDLFGTTNLSETFKGCSKLVTINNGNLWNTSNVVDMSSMFESCEGFKGDISAWDVSNVVDMNRMFKGTKAFNVYLGGWNVSSVVDMTEMFYSAAGYNRSLGAWDVSSVKFFDGFMNSSVPMSPDNLSETYKGWGNNLSGLVVPNINPVSFTGLRYKITTGQAGRDILTGPPNNWVIVDGGGI